MKILKNLVLLLALFTSTECFSSEYVVWGTTIAIYAQSREGSTANMIQSTKGIYNGGDHPWCGKRAYIDFDDKEIFSAALAASMSQKPVNFIYEDAATLQLIAGHEKNRCKVISIFQ
jgi:hypothetical protein